MVYGALEQAQRLEERQQRQELLLSRMAEATEKRGRLTSASLGLLLVLIALLSASDGWQWLVELPFYSQLLLASGVFFLARR